MTYTNGLHTQMGPSLQLYYNIILKELLCEESAVCVMLVCWFPRVNVEYYSFCNGDPT